MRITLIAVCFVTCAFADDSGWSFYGGDAGGTRYSGLKQITRQNVRDLRPVWTYRTGALQPHTPLNGKAAFEATPILVDGTLYLKARRSAITERSICRAERFAPMTRGQPC
ncbi:MAG TPA: hypothetical protein VIY49_37310 [Bryobacteraceae bacterium]